MLIISIAQHAKPIVIGQIAEVCAHFKNSSSLVVMKGWCGLSAT